MHSTTIYSRHGTASPFRKRKACVRLSLAAPYTTLNRLLIAALAALLSISCSGTSYSRDILNRFSSSEGHLESWRGNIHDTSISNIKKGMDVPEAVDAALDLHQYGPDLQADCLIYFDGCAADLAEAKALQSEKAIREVLVGDRDLLQVRAEVVRQKDEESQAERLRLSSINRAIRGVIDDWLVVCTSSAAALVREAPDVPIVVDLVVAETEHVWTRKVILAAKAQGALSNELRTLRVVAVDVLKQFLTRALLEHINGPPSAPDSNGADSGRVPR